ncbi:MFS transporter [Actinacidiphila sp. DG2A-62]|uniref:MFS transporter n=1 Tax=Actinacidiphila sp. DG2A-62 TaxID=3108821 RepID=UPI002DBEAD97|nr:MFS transporter [Actinacidiphila sp. DG2A-62]MEC3997949.1 MFS transporter [Actinacidiphila sp. DG2A-62]
MTAPATPPGPAPTPHSATALTNRQVTLAFRGLLAVRLLGALADGVMLPFVVLWAHRDGGLSGAAAGALFLVQAVGEFTGGLAGGALADRIGHRRMLLISTTGMALGYGSLFLVHHAVLAIGAFLLAGLFESAFHPTIAALIGDLHADEDLHRAYGLTRVVASVGGVVGPVLGAAAVALSLSSMFAAAGVLLAGAVLAVCVAVPSDRAIGPRTSEGDDEEEPAGALGQILRDRRLALLVLGGGLLAITFTWFEADGLVLLRRLHSLGTTAYAVLFAVDAVATVAFQTAVSRWARRRGTARVLFAGAALQGAGLAAMAAAGLGYPVLVAAVLVMSFGMMLSGPTTSAFVSRHAAPGRGATYQAALSTTQDIGTAIGPTSGLALGRTGPAALVWLLALPLSLVAGLATVRAARPARGEESGPAAPADGQDNRKTPAQRGFSLVSEGDLNPHAR